MRSRMSSGDYTISLASESTSMTKCAHLATKKAGLFIPVLLGITEPLAQVQWILSGSVPQAQAADLADEVDTTEVVMDVSIFEILPIKDEANQV